MIAFLKAELFLIWDEHFRVIHSKVTMHLYLISLLLASLASLPFCNWQSGVSILRVHAGFPDSSDNQLSPDHEKSEISTFYKNTTPSKNFASLASPNRSPYASAPWGAAGATAAPGPASTAWGPPASSPTPSTTTAAVTAAVAAAMAQSPLPVPAMRTMAAATAAAAAAASCRQLRQVEAPSCLARRNVWCHR